MGVLLDSLADVRVRGSGVGVLVVWPPAAACGAIVLVSWFPLLQIVNWYIGCCLLCLLAFKAGSPHATRTVS